MHKKNKQVMRLLKLTAIYFVATAIVVYIVIYRINASIVVDTSADDMTKSNQQGPVATPAVTVSGNMDKATGVYPGQGKLYTLSGIPANAKDLSFSSDGLYCTYISNNKLYITEIPSSKIIKEIAAKGAVTNSVLMYDRNIVIYFTINNNTIHGKAASGEEITVNSYNIDTKHLTVHSSFIVASGSIIKQIDYSSLTGQVYFNIECGKADTIYHINIMKKLIKITVGGSIDNMILTNARQNVYYDKDNTLYCQLKPVKRFNNIKIRILGCDIYDNVYLQSQVDKACVYVTKDNIVVKTIRLDDPDFTKVYINKTAVYLVYPNHILKLSTDGIKNISYNENCIFKGFISNHLYLLNKDGSIIVTKQ